jgi:phosphoglucosamine mutase
MLFGTDGVRGLSSYFFEKALAYNLGRAVVCRDSRSKKVVIARDTRLSGEAIENEVIRGLSKYPTEIVGLSIMPTMTVSEILRRTDADYGIMVSASHNPPEYNGIKIFDATGQKLTAEEEADIERAVFSFWERDGIAADAESGDAFCSDGESGDKKNAANANGAENRNILHTGGNGARSVLRGYEPHKDARIVGLGDAGEIYKKSVLNRLGARLDGLNIRLDCCFGACSKIAPEIFRAAGANVFTLAAELDGSRINVGTGSTNIGYLRANISETDFLGCAFDGDGDRMLAVAPNGFVIDGDYILYILTLFFKRRGLLKKNTVVGTLMTNYGLEEALKKEGVGLIRTDVGDKYVVEKIKEGGYSLGGETSGHIVMNEDGGGATGDGILAALTLARAFAELDIKPGKAAAPYAAFPQKTADVKASAAVKKAVLNDGRLNALLELCKDGIRGSGRILARPSGTEDKLRITVEARTEKTVDEVLSLLIPAYTEACAELEKTKICERF